MAAFIARRALFLPVLWLAVTLAIFAMVAPLGPYQRLALYVSVDPKSLSTKQGPADLRRLIALHHLDDPFLVQYQRWLLNVAHGELGWSQTAQRPVSAAILSRLPATLELALFAIVPMVGLGIWLGTVSAVHRGRWLDGSLRMLSVGSLSAQPFLIGILLLLVFYGLMGWFPPGRLSPWAEQAVQSGPFLRITGMSTVDAVLNLRPDILADALRHLLLPMLTLAITGWAFLMRITRGSMLEALGTDYVTAARAKGVPERRVISHHARRNAMIPITTSAMGMFIGLIGGVVLVEQVFNYPGLGQWGLQAAQFFDVPAVIGITLLGATFVVVGNLVVDIAYAVLDPRVRY